MHNIQFISLSESALLLSFGDTIDETVHETIIQAKYAIEQSPFKGFVEVVPAYLSLTVYYNPAEIVKQNNQTALQESITALLKDCIAKTSSQILQQRHAIEIPVCYDDEYGIDLAELSSQLHLSKEDIIQLHSAKTYKVYMIGFTPGFAYMGTVDEKLFSSRKEKPRLQVKAGSVGIAVNQTGIYPLSTPGGWNIIGKTPLQIFNKQQQNPFLLKAGDMVQFVPVSKEKFESASRLTPPSDGIKNTRKLILHQTGVSDGDIIIQQCGFLTTLQDAGRTGFLQYGITHGGTMDPWSYQQANALVGNAGNEVAIEITQSPHSFCCKKDILLAFTGGGLQPEINHTMIPLNQPVFIPAGTVINMKQPIPGYRLYMAAAGGLNADSFLGSCSTDLLIQEGGHHGRSLKKDDQLQIKNKPSPAQKKLMNVLQKNVAITINILPKTFSQKTIRVMKGVEWNFLNESSKQTLSSFVFTIGMQSNRMGYRLQGNALQTSQPCEITSSAVTQGTVQLTPGGDMIVLMADAQTIGGYPRIMQVCSADISLLAQKKPGDEIQFQIISLEEAEELYLNRLEEINHIRKMFNSVI